MAEAALLEKGHETEGRIREDGAKRRQILDGAREVILRHGFDAASMNEIARIAGVSKGTLYVYFSSKEDLFGALIREEKRAQVEQICRFEELRGDIRTSLVNLGSRFLTMILEPSSIAQFRTVAAASAKFPQIGRAYYEAGPLVGIERLASYLEGECERGALAIPDTTRAAVQLLDLYKGFYLTRAIFAAGTVPSEGEIRNHVEHAVALFLKAYAV